MAVDSYNARKDMNKRIVKVAHAVVALAFPLHPPGRPEKSRADELDVAVPLRIVMAHHPLVDADTESSGSTRGGKRALAALGRAGAQVVLSGHVHDPFDLMVEPSPGLPMRLIGGEWRINGVRLRALPGVGS